MNKDMHTGTRRLPRDKVRRKRPEKWRTNSSFLLHNNAPAHWPALVKDFLSYNNVTTLECPPYFPDLIPADFFPVSPNEISAQGTALLCCYCHHQECDGKAEKSLTTWLLGTFTTPSQSLTEVYSCKRGLF